MEKRKNLSNVVFLVALIVGLLLIYFCIEPSLINISKLEFKFPYKVVSILIILKTMVFFFIGFFLAKILDIKKEMKILRICALIIFALYIVYFALIVVIGLFSQIQVDILGLMSKMVWINIILGFIVESSKSINKKLEQLN